MLGIADSDYYAVRAYDALCTFLALSGYAFGGVESLDKILNALDGNVTSGGDEEREFVAAAKKLIEKRKAEFHAL